MREHVRAFAPYVLGALTLNALRRLVGDDAATWSVTIGVPLMLGLLGGGALVRDRVDRWRTMRTLRQLPAARRLEALASFDPAMQALFANALALDGSEVTDGPVERFPFPLRRIGLLERAEIVVVAFGVAALLFVGFAEVGTVTTRWALLVVGILTLPAAIVLRSWHRRSCSVLEVSPFGIVEVTADGRRTRIGFAQSLILVNEPRWRRMQIGPAASDLRITLHYGRMGFFHLVDRVLEYGGFREAV